MFIATSCWASAASAAAISGNGSTPSTSNGGRNVPGRLSARKSAAAIGGAIAHWLPGPALMRQYSTSAGIVRPAPHSGRQDLEGEIALGRKGTDVDRGQLGLALQGQVPAYAALDPPVGRREEAQSDDRPLEALLVLDLDHPETDVVGLGRRG